jgi:NitT/TauT family transport system permease protein
MSAGVEGDLVGGQRFTSRDRDELSDRPDDGRIRRQIVRISRVILVVGVISLWQYASGRWIDPFWISSPDAVLARLRRLVEVGESPWEWVTRFPESTLWFHVQFTIRAMLLGLVWGTLAGITVGFVLGRSPFLGDVFNPLLIALYSLPKLALAPLFILWFGIGLRTKVVYSATIVFFLVFLNTYSGVREVDRDLVNTVRIFGGSRRTVLFKVVLPSALTWVFAGLSLSVPYSLVGAVVAEMMASNRGMGFLVVSAANQFDTGGVFAALVVLVIVAVIVNLVVERVRAYLLRWKGAGA